MKNKLFFVFIIGMCILAFACAKDESTPYDRNMAQAGNIYLQGMAADGDPINGVVFVQGMKKQETNAEENVEPEIDEVMAMIGPDGTFKCNVSNLNPPYVLKAKGMGKITNVEYYSISSSDNDWTNCTKFSDAAVRMATNNDPEKAFRKTIQMPDNYEKSKEQIKQVVQSLLPKLPDQPPNFDPKEFDPFTSQFVATSNDLFDNLLGMTKITVSSESLAISSNQLNNAVPILSLNYKQNGSFVADISNDISDDLNKLDADTFEELKTNLLSTIVKLTILQTSDLHNHASGYGPISDYTPMDTSDNDSVTGGFARLASKIAEIKLQLAAADIPLLLVDSGNYFMGTMYDMAASAPVPFLYFQALGYDAITLGNHEFDWAPAGLAKLINNGINNELMPFNVPIVASNAMNLAESELYTFTAASPIPSYARIFDHQIKTLTNGLKVGILGLMGESAGEKALAAKPVSFDHDVQNIKSKLNDLRINKNCDIILILAHGYVNKDDEGSDEMLADAFNDYTNVIIAAGHAHQPTSQPYVADDNQAFVFSSGLYGQYLSRLNIQYDTKHHSIVDYSFDLIEMNDTIKGFKDIDDAVNLVNAAITENIQESLGITVDEPVAILKDYEINFSDTTARPSGLGNLCTDAFRAVANEIAKSSPNTTPFMFSVMTNGNLKDSLKPGQSNKITFADIYNVLPMGLSPKAATVANVPPGYPLYSVYFNAADIRNLCEIAVAVELKSHPLLTADYYLHFSGIKYEYNPTNELGYRVNKVSFFNPNDPMCTNNIHQTLPSEYEPNSIWDSKSTNVYRAVVDLYFIQMFYMLGVDPTYDDFKALLPVLRDKNGNPMPVAKSVDAAQYVSFSNAYAIDTGIESGAQELYAWTALLKYMQAWKGNENFEHYADLPVVPVVSPYNDAILSAIPRVTSFTYNDTLASLTLLQTSDIHNHASGYGPFLDYTPMDTSDNDGVAGGMARLAGKIASIKINRLVSNVPMLLVDSGDYFMGTMYDLAASAPVPFIYFQALGYDAITLGNHEFDWAPTGLAMLINNGVNNTAMPFNVPIVASNTLIPAGNALTPFQQSGLLVDNLVKELPNGLKVGILGWIGIEADAYAPAANPVTFDHEIAHLQGKVDALKLDGCDLIVLLSHGGVNEYGEGDDKDLALAVNGIDIIASGHAHTATNDAFEVNNTLIFSPGSFGQYLSRLDIQFNRTTKSIVSHTFELIEMNDTIQGFADIHNAIELVDANISANISTSLGINVDTAVAILKDFEITFSETKAAPSGLGNLCTDATRAVANVLALSSTNTKPYMLSIMANGNLRDTLKPGKTGKITFSDIFNVLPLGLSPKAATVPGVPPGYPLYSVYLNAADIRKLCEIAVAVELQSHPLLTPEYYLHFSGIQYAYNPTNELGYRVNKVSFFSPTDPMCVGSPVQTLPSEYAPDSIWDGESKHVYRAVVDLYLLQMFYTLSVDPKYQDFLALLPVYRDKDGNPLPLEKSVDAEQYASFSDAYAIDTGIEPGAQELYAWTALLKYMQAWKGNDNFVHEDGLPVIPSASPYNEAVLSVLPRVNKFTYDDTIADLTIFQTSDIHNHASGYGPLLDYTPMDTSDNDGVTGGMARLAGKIVGMKINRLVSNVPMLLVDSGDYFMGTMYDLAATAPVPFIYFQALGYDAITLGNHEFDWAPAGLAMLINNGVNNPAMPFNVPIVASNTIIPSGNQLIPFQQSGLLRENLIKTYPNGLKVGILGWMGIEADAYAPAASPVTFDHKISNLQDKVDALKSVGCDLIVLLSHGGVDEYGEGDDKDLALAVNGIDIIASGHAHTATNDAFEVNNTLIFSPGSFGQYLSRLDIQYNRATESIVSHTFELIEINDTIQGFADIHNAIELVDANISASINASLGINVDTPVAVLKEFEIKFSESKAAPSGLGNLCTDATRAVANALALSSSNTTPYMLSIMANGNLRDTLKPGKTGKITFSDIFNVLPLGLSPKAATVSDIPPGYPLYSVYLNAADIRKLCEIAVAVELQSHPLLTPSYYLHFSGIKYEYNATNELGQRVNNVSFFNPADPMCTGGVIQTLPSDYIPNSIWDSESKVVYRAVVDLYLLQMFYTLSVDLKYNDFLPLLPIFRDKNGDPLPLEQSVDAQQYISFSNAYAIDTSIEAGAQELYAWTALLKYMQAWKGNDSFVHEDGLPVIPSSSPYNEAVLSVLPRVNKFTYDDTIADLTILQTSDIHNHASGYGPLLDYTPLDLTDNDGVTGGMARLAGKIVSLKVNRLASNVPMLLVDSGDYFMGTMYDMAASAPVPFIYFEALDYDAITLGNHEFDWGPAGLAMLINNGINNTSMPFNVPIVASNTIIPSGNALSSFEGNLIVENIVKSLPNGLMVGILGWMGIQADAYAPAANPVTFDHTVSSLQDKVDALKSVGCDLIVLLSHGGVEESGNGDDKDLANAVNGLDIIASGHAHTATNDVFEVNDTLIFSPGSYGQYLSRLDIKYNFETKSIVSHTFDLIEMNDTVLGYADIQNAIEQVNAGISDNISTSLGIDVDTPVALLKDFEIKYKESEAGESGLGNLCTDAIRAVANQLAQISTNQKPYMLSLIANGTVRDSIKPGKTGKITFSDIFNVLPLGLSLKAATTQGVPPGYPLYSVYLNAADIRKLCELSVAVKLQSHPLLTPEYYLHFSGIKYAYNATSQLGQRVKQVSFYHPTDSMCTESTIQTLSSEYGPSDTIWDDNSKVVYRAVVDLYLLQMFYTLSVDPNYSAFLPLLPTFRDQNGDALPLSQSIDADKYMSFSNAYAIDTGIEDGAQELYAWAALLKYIQAWSSVFPLEEGLPVLPETVPYNHSYVSFFSRVIEQ
jgi:2',3'-cyclic-nucleotide 2'-phosphodiesterase (5'-nucleotidase family)